MFLKDITITKAVFEDLKEKLSLQRSAFQMEAGAHGNYDIEPLQQTYESICNIYFEVLM